MSDTERGAVSFIDDQAPALPPLPDLPPPAYPTSVTGGAFDHDQMRAHAEAYAAAAVAAAVERCAKLCEDADTFIYDDPGAGFASLIRAENQGRAALPGLHTPT